LVPSSKLTLSGMESSGGLMCFLSRRTISMQEVSSALVLFKVSLKALVMSP